MNVEPLNVAPPSIDPLYSISPIDGRYHQKTQPLQTIFSEYGLMKYRLEAELAWLSALAQESNIAEVPLFNTDTQTFLDTFNTEFSLNDAKRIKEFEQTTNHDVKALEYFIKEKINTQPSLKKVSEFVHFGCTSEDINNVAHALMLKNGRAILLASLRDIMGDLAQMATQNAAVSMLSRTHGQAASPTTLGKEIANVYERLNRQYQQLAAQPICAKFNGAVGNFNAHLIAYPTVDWPNLCQNFIERLGLQYTPLSTQIEPHDYIAEYFHTLSRINTILLDFSRDVWGYIAIGYFTQKAISGEVGSSTMPHKVNPIDFENAEGNLGLANALGLHLAEKLPISRWQRDLSDSTVLRNLGVVCAYSLIAYQSLKKGISKLAVNQQAMADDLNSNPQVLTEAVQTLMRRYGIDNPYERLKEFSRGKEIDTVSLSRFIDTLKLPNDVKIQLKQLTPSDYIGNASLFKLSRFSHD